MTVFVNFDISRYEFTVSLCVWDSRGRGRPLPGGRGRREGAEGGSKRCLRLTPDCPHRALSPAPRSSGHLKPPLSLHSVTVPSSPQPLRTSGPRNPFTSAPLPQVNGGFGAPPHQPPEADEPPRSPCKKRKRKRSAETRGPGSEVGEAAAPPGRRRRKRRKRPGDTDTTPPQEGQPQGQHQGPEHRSEGRAQLGEEGRQPPAHGPHLENGWQAGCGTDGPHVSPKKRRRKGAEGPGGEDRLHQDPPWHR